MMMLMMMILTFLPFCLQGSSLEACKQTCYHVPTYTI